MGAPGKRAFSFLRGDMELATVQKASRIGIEVKRAKKIVVFHPPPIFHAR